jgi:hypothetical protein
MHAGRIEGISARRSRPADTVMPSTSGRIQSTTQPQHADLVGLPGSARHDYRICYSCLVREWEIYQTNEVAAWLGQLQADDPRTAGLVDDAIYALSRAGPGLGRPLADTIAGSSMKNLKELRPPSAGTTKIRILFAFDPWRSAILLVAGNKAGKWNRWYAEAIPRAEELYEIYLKERAEEESGR